MSETTGQRIKDRRKLMGMTQEDLAQKVGVSFHAVSKWENDSSMPDIGLLNRVAETIGMSVEELLNGNVSADGVKEGAVWGKITGTVTKDIHADVGTIVGEVNADIYGNVNGDITGNVNNIYGNVEGNITGNVNGDITGYVRGNLLGTVKGSVKLGVRGKILGSVIGDGINVPDEKSQKNLKTLFSNFKKTN